MKTCKKMGYATVQEAMRVVELGKKTWHREPRRFYKCPDCGNFHVTSHAKRLGQ